MNIFIEQSLMLVCAFTFCLFNASLGYLGLMIGEHRMKKHAGSTLSFKEHANIFTEKAYAAHRSGDISVLVAFLIFAHLGFLVFLLLSFGPRGQDKYVESRINIK